MIEAAIKSLRQGNTVIIFDDGAPVPCGYFLASAKDLREEEVLKIINISRGILLVPISEELSKARGLFSLTADSKHPFPITIGVEARSGVGSGISVSDRTKTIRSILESTGTNRNIAAPGHVFPLPARKGGLLLKTGIAEASVDLLKIADLPEVGVVSHILDQDGSFLSEEKLQLLATNQNIPFTRMSSIVQHRLVNEKIVSFSSKANLPTAKYGNFEAHCFISNHDQAEHLVLSKGDYQSTEPVLTRMHSEKKLGDIFSITKGNDRNKIDRSLSIISKEGRGVLVYIRKAKRI